MIDTHKLRVSFLMEMILMDKKEVKDKMACQECGEKLTTPRGICGECLYDGLKAIAKRS